MGLWSDIPSGSVLQSYGNRCPITIPAITSGNNLLPAGVAWDGSSNFPFPLNLANGPAALNTCLASGHDFVLTPSWVSGDDPYPSRLYFERDAFTGGGGSAVGGWLWGNTAALLSGSAATTLYLWWNNPSASDGSNPASTWDSNTAAVYHLGASGALSLVDSTANANTLSNTGSPPVTAVAGVVGGAASFSGSVLSASGSGSLDITGSAITLEAWVYPLGGGYKAFLAKSANWSDRQYGLFLSGAGTNALYLSLSGVTPPGPAGGDEYLSASWVVDAWNYIALVYVSGVGVVVYLNGVARFLAGWTGSITHVDSNLTLGGDVSGGYLLSGYEDEVRLSNNGRSAAWVGLVYNSITNQSSAWWGAAQSKSPSSSGFVPIARQPLLMLGV